MRRSRRDVREDLRLAVRCLPQHTRVAMLEGVQRNDIIVGAYTDRKGGVCPMLAAHRCGGRTSFVSFARAWDRFAGARRARPATPRELKILEEYQPPAASPDEIAAAVAAAIAETGATTPKDMGKVMKAVMPKLAGKSADGRAVNEAVRRALGA